jgi:hypothetical protein
MMMPAENNPLMQPPKIDPPNNPTDDIPGVIPPTVPPEIDPSPVRQPPEPPQLIGEGSYEGTRGYAASVESYLTTANVAEDAADAAPDTAQEDRELDAAEAEGLARSKADGE